MTTVEINHKTLDKVIQSYIITPFLEISKLLGFKNRCSKSPL